jgi:catecholate siderophore receptor
VTRKLRVLGAYTFIDAKVVKSNTAAEVGKFFQNTPKHSVSVWATYTAKRFNFGVGPRAMTKRFGNNTNTRVVDGYWTLDAMAGFVVNDHIDLRLNLTNLNDAYYFDRLGGGHVIPGQGRGALLSVNWHL